jgi:uncharacterized protein YeaO (DUF488 family)
MNTDFVIGGGCPMCGARNLEPHTENCSINKYSKVIIPETTHVLDKIIQDIDDFRNEYTEDIDYKVDNKIDKLAEIIHELVITLKYQ